MHVEESEVREVRVCQEQGAECRGTDQSCGGR